MYAGCVEVGGVERWEEGIYKLQVGEFSSLEPYMYQYFLHNNDTGFSLILHTQFTHLKMVVDSQPMQQDWLLARDQLMEPCCQSLRGLSH